MEREAAQPLDQGPGQRGRGATLHSELYAQPLVGKGTRKTGAHTSMALLDFRD